MRKIIISFLVIFCLSFLHADFTIETIAKFDKPIAKAIFDQETGELKEVVLGTEPLSPGSYKNEVSLPTAVLFYKGGEIIKRVDIPPAGIVRLFHSHSGNYVAIQRVFGERQEVGPPILTGGGEFILYDSEGKVVWKKNILVGRYIYDAPIPQITLSDSGEFIVWDGELTYYDLEGNKRDISGGCSGASWVRVSEDGRFFIVSHNCYGIPTLSLYHHSGKLKWRVESPNRLKVHGIWISPHGNYVIGHHFYKETFFEGRNVKDLPEEIREKVLSKEFNTKFRKEGKITELMYRIDFALDSTGQLLWLNENQEYPSMAPQNPYEIFFDKNEKYFAEKRAKPRGPVQEGIIRLFICEMESGEVILSIPFTRRYWLKLGQFSNDKVAFILRKGIPGTFFYQIYEMKGNLILREELVPHFIPSYVSQNLKVIKGLEINQNKVSVLEWR